MPPAGKAKKVTIFVNHSATHHAGQVSSRILERLQAEGAVGVAVFRATAAIDTSGRLHTLRLAEVVPDLPVMMIWIDSPEPVERILPHVDELLTEGVITVEETAVVAHVTGAPTDLPKAALVGDVMTRDVVAVHPETPIEELVEDLVEKAFRAVPVVDDERRVVGIVTNGDLVRRGGLPVRLELLRTFDTPALHAQLTRLAESHREVREIMTRPAITVPLDMDVRHAAELMLKRKLKRLPVVDGTDRLAGIVSRVDLLRTVGAAGQVASPSTRILPHVNGTAPVSEIMVRVVPTVTADMPLPQVVNVVASTRLNRAVVVDASRHVLGVVTDAELIERLTPQARPGALTVLMHRMPFVHGSKDTEELLLHTTGKTAHDVMQADIVIAREDEAIRDVLASMLQQGKKVVPIVDANGELVGMVDRADLLRLLVQG